MVRYFVILLSWIQLQASIFDWFHPLSDRAKKVQALLEKMDDSIEGALQDYRVPGLAIGVVVDGSLVYAKGFGFRDREKQLPVTKDTLFPIGSCSKAFTSFLVGTLVDEGVVSWDTPVSHFVPGFRLWDPYATAHITLRDMLAHRSGLPRHDWMWYNSSLSRADVMQRLRYLEPSCEFRERYQYNNLMYLAAGCAIEQLTGQKWEDLIRERILSPLEMPRTNFSIAEMQQFDDYASPYVEKDRRLQKMGFRDISLIGAAGAMNSNVTELSHWLMTHLNGGVYKGVSRIGLATLQETHTPQVIIPGAPEAKECSVASSGLGWWVVYYRGREIISHDGVSDGFTTTVGLAPQEGVGLVIMANRNLTSLPRFLFLHLIDQILGTPSVDWLSEGKKTLEVYDPAFHVQPPDSDAIRKKGSLPSHDLEDFIGEYEHPAYGTVIVDLEDGELKCSLNGISWSLQHWHYNVFSLQGESEATFLSREGTKVAFRSNIRGDVSELLMALEPAVSDVIFKKKEQGIHQQSSYLRRFTGLYEIYGYTIEISIRNHTLCALIPGQPIYELIPSSPNEFLVKAMPGNIVRFILAEDGRVEQIVLVRPYGSFTAHPKR